jgi:pimeloyl-ACP methyl ester carboxylesterase
MGAIVATCYISAFPHKVCGFVNMDGVPYPFIIAKAGFEFAAKLYKMYTYIIWTGKYSTTEPALCIQM